MAQSQLSKHFAIRGCYWSLKHDNKFLGLFRTECKDDRLLKGLVSRIFDGPTHELRLRIYCRFLIRQSCLERQIFWLKWGQNLLDSLLERVSGSVNFKRESLHIHGLVGNKENISQVLAREKLTERNDFLVNFSDFSNVQLSPLASISRFEQISGSQVVKLAKDSSWLLEAAQHVRRNKFSEVSNIFAWTSMSLKHLYLLLF